MRYGRLSILLIATALFLAGSLTWGQAQSGWGAVSPSSTGYEITWSTVDGGGYTFSTGGGYSLGGTIGQADASTSTMSGGNYTLAGGFWNGLVEQFKVYLPAVLKNY